MANKKLKELLSVFPETARRLVVEETLGHECRPTLEMLGVGEAYADNLRFCNPNFKETEKNILDNVEAFKAEAADMEQAFIDEDAATYLKRLILKAGRDPDSLSPGEHRLVLSAIGERRKLSKPRGRSVPSTYDAQVLSRGSR
jgi:hypothetical protein